MNGKAHLTIGCSVSVAMILYGAGAGNAYAPIAAIGAPLGAMLPDSDHNHTKMGRVRKTTIDTAKKVIGLVAFIAFILLIFSEYKNSGLIAALLKSILIIGPLTLFMILTSSSWFKKKTAFYTEHRGIMHSGLPIVCLMYGSITYESPFLHYILFGIALGYASHLFADCCTINGCPLLWPITKRPVRILKTRAGGKAEWFLVLIIGGGIIWIGSYFGHFTMPF